MKRATTLLLIILSVATPCLACEPATASANGTSQHRQALTKTHLTSPRQSLRHSASTRKKLRHRSALRGHLKAKTKAKAKAKATITGRTGVTATQGSTTTSTAAQPYSGTAPVASPTSPGRATTPSSIGATGGGVTGATEATAVAPMATGGTDGTTPTIAALTPPSWNPLLWAPPTLVNPVTVQVTTQNALLTLNDNQDYILDLGNQPVDSTVRIQGGHNIVLIGGEIDVPESQAGSDGIYLRNQSAGAHIHIEGVDLSGPGMSDGFGIEEPSPDTTVDLENVRVESLHSPYEPSWVQLHPDLIQTDTGPTYLRVDGFTGYTPYQGFFLTPNDSRYGGVHNPTAEVELDNIDLHHRQDMAQNASVMLWQNTPFTMLLGDVWIDPGSPAHNPTFWPAAAPWTGVNIGTPADGSFVPAGSVGIGYQSPGYLEAPQVSTPPQINGVMTKGATLQVLGASWSGPDNTSVQFQWQRCAPATGCVDIPGATNTQYTLTEGDVGDTITVVETGSSIDGQSTPVSADEVGPVASLASPGSVVDPSITGTPTDGQTLTARTGLWATTGLTPTYQWQRCLSGVCVNIAGAVYGTYGLTSADVGYAIRLVVTATGTLSGAEVANSDPTSVVSPPNPPVSTILPTVSSAVPPGPGGIPPGPSGVVLTAGAGTWSTPDRVRLTYQWRYCSSASCANIAGATYSTERITAAYAGDSVYVVVTATDAEEQATSTPSNSVQIAA